MQIPEIHSYFIRRRPTFAHRRPKYTLHVYNLLTNFKKS